MELYESFSVVIERPPAPLAITSPAILPNATVGTPYSYQMQAIGGQQPYNWSLLSVQQYTATAAPSSLTLSGISGTSGTTGNATATPTGSIAPFGFSWSWQNGGTGLVINNPGGAVTNFTAPGPLSFGQAVSGVAICSVTDGFGRSQPTGTVSVSISRVTQLAASASPTTLSQPGATASITTSSATVTGSGGKAPYTYRWTWQSGGVGITINSATGATTSFTGTGLSPGGSESGTAVCTVSDQSGQTATATVAVAVNRVTLVSASASPTSLSSSGTGTTQTTGLTTVTASGGQTPYSYSWAWTAGGANLTINSRTSATTSVTGSAMTQGTTYTGTMTCTVTDAFGQTASPAPNVSVSIQCLKSSYSGTLTAGSSADGTGFGFTSGQYGSLVPQSDLNGNSILELSLQNTGATFQLEINNATTQGYFSTIVVNGTTLSSSGAAFTTAGSAGLWTWTSGVPTIVPGNQYAVTINY